jgi:hypothetical protein
MLSSTRKESARMITSPLSEILMQVPLKQGLKHDVLCLTDSQYLIGELLSGFRD